MQTTKRTLRTSFLGRQNNRGATSHSNTADAACGLPAEASANMAISRTYTSKELFGPGSELSIAHRGERYTLRITSLGKLILTK